MAGLFARPFIETEPTISEVLPQRCVACHLCEEVCPYGAVTFVELKGGRLAAQINPAVCKGCGLCAAGCRGRAIVLHGFDDQQLLAEVESLFARPVPLRPAPAEPEPLIAGAGDEECLSPGRSSPGSSASSATGAATPGPTWRAPAAPPTRPTSASCACPARGGSTRSSWPARSRRARTACSCSAATRATATTADGNYYTRRRFAVMRELLVFLGIEPERVKLDWVSASEGARFARVVSDFTEAVRRLGPLTAEADHTIAIPKAPAPPPFVADTGPLTAELRALATRLLAEKKVEVVVGWEKGTVGYRPLFARTPEQAARLELDARALLNLVTYLRGLAGKKAAVVVRPADMRALNVLLHEGQVKREDLFLIGVGGDSGRGPLPASAYDALLGRAPESIDGGLPPFPAVEEIEAWPAAKRAAFWNAQFESCLRCYACRQACPLCYCKECMAEQLDPAWQSIAIETGEKAFFHVMRAFHQAGRCTGCKACAGRLPGGHPDRAPQPEGGEGRGAALRRLRHRPRSREAAAVHDLQEGRDLHGVRP